VLDILSEALRAATDHLSAGFAICTADGRLLHANRAAKEMMEKGWPVRNQGDYLRPSDRARAGAMVAGLRQVTKEALNRGSSSVSLDVPLASFKCLEGVAIATLRPLAVQEHCLVAIYVTTLAAGQAVDISGIAECYELTPAETRTLEQFVRGRSVAEAATALMISQNTVKTHLRNIFIKTNSSRQQQLMSLASGMMPPLRGVNPSGTPQRLSNQDVKAGHEALLAASWSREPELLLHDRGQLGTKYGRRG
jgi:DNA-binding CsgD family transcriptional regulator